LTRKRKVGLLLAITALAVAILITAVTSAVGRVQRAARHATITAAGGGTYTPIKHVVVIFQENVSFDHYFGTYPNAANLPGERPFHAAPATPTVNGLSGALLTANPNLSNPQRLTPSQALTCDQDHGYTAEQNAFDHGLMDRFVQSTGHNVTLAACLAAAPPAASTTPPRTWPWEAPTSVTCWTGPA
jgi:phospholipase C